MDDGVAVFVYGEDELTVFVIIPRYARKVYVCLFYMPGYKHVIKVGIRPGIIIAFKHNLSRIFTRVRCRSAFNHFHNKRVEVGKHIGYGLLASVIYKLFG